MFWKYFDKEWIRKAKMWLTGMCNIPHAGQDITAVIEFYHSESCPEAFERKTCR